MLFSSASHKANIYTSTKTCIKNEWHDYGEYIYPLSISKLREAYALSKCFSLLWYTKQSKGMHANWTVKNLLAQLELGQCSTNSQIFVHVY